MKGDKREDGFARRGKEVASEFHTLAARLAACSPPDLGVVHTGCQTQTLVWNKRVPQIDFHQEMVS